MLLSVSKKLIYLRGNEISFQLPTHTNTRMVKTTLKQIYFRASFFNWKKPAATVFFFGGGPMVNNQI